MEEFHIAASQVAAQTFEKHQERTITGQYEPIERTMPAGTYRIPMSQPAVLVTLPEDDPLHEPIIVPCDIFPSVPGVEG
jgi:hypothetical protein